MLYFSKLRIILVTLVSLFFVLLTISNFVKFESNYLNKRINLGLDLQGGSYLLLEIDNSPVIEQKLQNFSITVRNFFKDKNIRIKNLKFLDESISFEDELYHTFSTAALTITMKSMKECWEELRDQSPSEAAVEFSRTYWELRGEDLIPPFSYTQAKEL